MLSDAQIQEVKNKFSTAKNLAILLPASTTTDELAAGLSLYLAVKQGGKEVCLVTEDTLKVSHTNLYGVGDIKNDLPAVGSSDFVLSLEGIVDNQGLVPSLERLDWYPEGNNLNLVFHVVPGQKFEPTKLATKYQTSGLDLVFLVGAANPQEVGNVYAQNIGRLSEVAKVNIDNSQSNTSYGQINIVDINSSSVSEMVAQLILGLGLAVDADIASNILAGIYQATNNLSLNVTPNTFMAASQMMQSGGKLPAQAAEAQPVQPISAPQGQFQQPISQPLAPVQPQPQGFDLQKILQVPPQPSEAPSNPTIATSGSQDEKPTGEFVASGSAESENPAPDWLVPKVYKGGSLG